MGGASGLTGELVDKYDGNCQTEFESDKILEAGFFGMVGGGLSGGFGGWASDAFDPVTRGAFGGVVEIYSSGVGPAVIQVLDSFDGE